MDIVKLINRVINEEIRKVRLKESSETKILMSGQSSFMKRFAVPQFKKAGIQFKVDDDGDILEIRAAGDEKLIEKISSFLEAKDSNGDYGGWFLEESKLSKWINKIINEEIAKVRLKEDRFVAGTHPTRKAYWTYLETLPKEQLLRIAKSKQKIDSMDKSTPKGDLVSNIFFSEFGKDITKPIKLPPYAEKYLAKFMPKESKLTEKSESEEIREMAVDLIDYLGAQLPPQISPRAIGFFRELGFKDTDPMVKKVYQTALQLNSGNR